MMTLALNSTDAMQHWYLGCDCCGSGVLVPCCSIRQLITALGMMKVGQVQDRNGRMEQSNGMTNEIRTYGGCCGASALLGLLNVESILHF